MKANFTHAYLGRLPIGKASIDIENDDIASVVGAASAMAKGLATTAIKGAAIGGSALLLLHVARSFMDAAQSGLTDFSSVQSDRLPIGVGPCRVRTASTAVLGILDDSAIKFSSEGRQLHPSTQNIYEIKIPYSKYGGGDDAKIIMVDGSTYRGVRPQQYYMTLHTISGEEKIPLLKYHTVKSFFGRVETQVADEQPAVTVTGMFVHDELRIRSNVQKVITTHQHTLLALPV